MTYIDDLQNTINLVSANNLSETYENLKTEIAKKHGYTNSLNKPISADEMDAKFEEFELICQKSGNHPFIQDLNTKKFSPEGFRYFGLAFYAHIYHAFEDVIFSIAQSAPPSIALRRIIIDNLWDEFGAGVQADSHLQIYEDTVISYLEVPPLTESEVLWLENSPKTEACLFAIKYGVDKNATAATELWSAIGTLPFRAALSAMVFGSEFTPRYLFPPIVSAIKKSDLPESVSRFFSMHIICDDCHFHEFMKVFVLFIQTKQDIVEAEAGLRIMLEIRNQFFDHLYEKNLLI